MGSILRFALILAAVLAGIGLTVKYFTTGGLEDWLGTVWSAVLIGAAFVIAAILSAGFEHIFTRRR